MLALTSISVSLTHINVKTFFIGKFYSVLANCLQFVAGLGPRKSDGLIKHYKKTNSRLETLDQLISDKFIQMRKFGKAYWKY